MKKEWRRKGIVVTLNDVQKNQKEKMHIEKGSRWKYDDYSINSNDWKNEEDKNWGKICLCLMLVVAWMVNKRRDGENIARYFSRKIHWIHENYVFREFNTPDPSSLNYLFLHCRL